MAANTKDNTQTLLNAPLAQLISRANEVRKTHTDGNLQLCSIVNARSGRCSEDCKFCAQSAKYHTDIPTHSLMENPQLIKAAQQAKAIGAERFGIVTSGNRLTDKEVNSLAAAIAQIKKETNLKICGSLGALKKSQLKLLKDAGLSRYHHNIETSRRFYPQIVSTHNFDERIDTIRSAKDIGLEVCSGGIIGLGENFQDRIDMAQTLKDLNVDSVPINILVPIKATPLEHIEPISPEDVIRTICIFRIILKDKTIKIAAGRETVLKDSQITGFLAGANGMIIGGYLTVKGQELKTDYALIEQIKKAWTK